MLIKNPEHIKELEAINRSYISKPWIIRAWCFLFSEEARSWSAFNPRRTTTEYLKKLVQLRKSAWFFGSVFGLLVKSLEVTEIYRSVTTTIADVKLYGLSNIRSYLTREQQNAWFNIDLVSARRINPERLFPKFLGHVVKGHRKDAQKILRRYPQFLLNRGTVMDDSGRTFSNITALEYLFWALDEQTYKKLLDCIPKTPEGDEIRAKVKLQYERFEGYDLGSLLTAARTPHKIYVQNTETGLNYEVIGFDGTLQKGLIPKAQLPQDLPKEVADIIKAKGKWLPIILEHTAKAGHTTAKSITQENHGLSYTFEGMSFAFAHFTTEEMKELKTLLQGEEFTAGLREINWIDENNPVFYQRLPFKQDKIQTLQNLLNQIGSEEANRLHKKLCTEEATILENHYDFELMDALQTQIDFYTTWVWPETVNPWPKIDEHWCRGVGGSQYKTTAKIRQAYCSNLTFEKINNLSDEDEWPEKMDYYNWLTQKNENFSSAVLAGGHSLGNDFGIEKIDKCGVNVTARPAGLGAKGDVMASVNLAGIGRLCQISTSKFLELKPRLTPQLEPSRYFSLT